MRGYLKEGVRMLEKNCYTIIGNKKVLMEMFEYLTPYLCKESLKEKYYQFTGRGHLSVVLEEDEGPAYDYIEWISEKYGLHPSKSQWVKFTKKENENARYYWLPVSYPLELEGVDAAEYGTQYEGGCERCGVGKVLSSDILVDRKLMKNKKMGCLEPDYFVNERIKDIILEHQLSGVTFEKRVFDYKKREMDNYYVLHIDSVLPSLSNRVWFEKDGCTCSSCGFQTSIRRTCFKYEANKLDNAKDFNLTEESLDNPRVRELIISQRIRQILKENGIRFVSQPVVLLDQGE